MASIACGLVAIGTCNGEVTSTILQTMMERSETDAKDTNARNLALGLGLTFLGKAVISEGKFSQRLPHFCYSKLSWQEFGSHVNKIVATAFDFLLALLQVAVLSLCIFTGEKAFAFVASIRREFTIFRFPVFRSREVPVFSVIVSFCRYF